MDTSDRRTVRARPSTVMPVWPTPAGRTLDVLFGACALTVTAPLLAVLWVVVRATSRGPALFRQRRVGRHGGEFTLYKFRTMRCDAAGPQVTGRDDCRVTGIGLLLRRFYLDELPQLFNVVRGDMTLVGPRPETPALACRYPPECRWVLDCRPGLTGPVQLRSGEFAALVSRQADPEAYYLTQLVPFRVALDAQFLTDPTVAKAVCLILRTVKCVLLPSGAPAVMGENEKPEGLNPDANPCESKFR